MIGHNPFRRRVAVLAVSAALAAPVVWARDPAGGPVAPLRRPDGPPMLTIAGRIGATNQGETAIFDRSMLEEIGIDGFVTATPWYDGRTRFEGVPMARLMQAVRANGSLVTAIALNDYSTDIPMTDFALFGVLLAMRRDGRPMRANDKGPLFIIYPFDSRAELQSRTYYSRSAWSVAQLIIR
jgi:hypothetical protein